MLPIRPDDAACHYRQVEIGDGCAGPHGRFRLLGLLGRNEAGAASSCFEPASSPLLLAGEAGEIVDLFVPTGVHDNLSHVAMITVSRFQGTGMSQVESGMRRAVRVQRLSASALERAPRPRHSQGLDLLTCRLAGPVSLPNRPACVTAQISLQVDGTAVAGQRTNFIYPRTDHRHHSFAIELPRSARSRSTFRARLTAAACSRGRFRTAFRNAGAALTRGTPLTLQFLLQKAASLVDVVVVDDDLHNGSFWRIWLRRITDALCVGAVYAK